MRAAATLARVRGARPVVAALARGLCLAAHVDVALIRRVRLTLVRGADVSAESDLWTSPLVQTRGAGAIVLRPDVVALLWAELAADGDALDATWAALDDARADASPLLRLEERLTWLALKGDRAALERELGAVVAAMVSDEARRRDLAAWAARALARLPEAVRETEAAKVLASAATGWVATPASVAAMAPTPEGARLAARIGRPTERVPISLRRVGDVLEVSGPQPPPWVTIDVPRHPLSVVIDEDRVVPLEAGAVARVDVRGDAVMVSAVDGRRWLLTRAGERPNLDAVTTIEGPGGQGAAYLVAPTLAVTSAGVLRGVAPEGVVGGFDDPFVRLGRVMRYIRDATERRDITPLLRGLDGTLSERLHELAQAEREFAVGAAEILRSNPSAALTLLDNARIHPDGGEFGGEVTELREAIERTAVGGADAWTGTLSFRGESFRARALGLDYTADIALLELDRPAPTTPLVLEHEARPGDAWAAYAPAPRGATHQNVWRGVVLAAWPRVTLGAPKPLDPTPLRGTPIFVDRKVIGHLGWDATDDAGLRATTGRLVAWWVKRLQDHDRALESMITVHRPDQHVLVAVVVSPGVALTLDGSGSLRAGTSVRVRLGDARLVEVSETVRMHIAARFGALVVLEVSDHQGRAPIAIGVNTPEARETVVLHLLAFSEQRESYSVGRFAVQVRGSDPNGGFLYVDPPPTPLGFEGGVVVHRGAVVALLEKASRRPLSPSQLVAFCIPDSVRAWLRERKPASTPRVVVRFPASISTEGLLTAALLAEGGVTHSYQYQTVLGQIREIVFDTRRSSLRDHELRVDVAVTEAGIEAPEVEVVVYEGRDLGSWPAIAVMECSRGVALEMPGALTSAGPLVSDEDFSGIRLYVRSLPRLSLAYSCRRALRFVTGLLAALDGLERGAHHLHLHLPGVNRLDLGDVARRVEARCEHWVRVKAIDPECDLVEVFIAATSPDDDGLSRAAEVATALETFFTRVYTRGDLGDPLDGQFGTSSERRGRVVEVVDAPDGAAVVVRALDDRPVRGYVTFYARAEVAAEPFRVRASGGVVRWVIPSSFPHPFVVGAIVEDEGIPLETRVQPVPSLSEASP
jgi:hypothetical protein